MSFSPVPAAVHRLSIVSNVTTAQLLGARFDATDHMKNCTFTPASEFRVQKLFSILSAQWECKDKSVSSEKCSALHLYSHSVILSKSPDCRKTMCMKLKPLKNLLSKSVPMVCWCKNWLAFIIKNNNLRLFFKGKIKKKLKYPKATHHQLFFFLDR